MCLKLSWTILTRLRLMNLSPLDSPLEKENTHENHSGTKHNVDIASAFLALLSMGSRGDRESEC